MTKFQTNLKRRRNSHHFLHHWWCHKSNGYARG